MNQPIPAHVTVGDAWADLSRAEAGAAAIMGAPNVHGPGQVEAALGVRYSKEQLQSLAAISVPDATLRECRRDHLLVAGYPLALRDLWERHANLFFNKRDAWFASEAFVGNAVDARWYLLRTEPLPGSRGKGYLEQCQLLAHGESVPRVCEVVFALVLHALATGDHILRDAYVRCRDTDPRGGHVDLGHFGPDGLIVGGSWDGHRSDTLGLAAARFHL